MAANMYRVGDYVYFENSSSNPLLIRRIEELNKTANGNVEAKVVCFYRRRDISSTLIALADKHARELEEEMENPEMADLPEKQKHQLRHRELFLSRQLESLPATHIRGKCCVTLLNETEALKSYLDREDAFFYSLVYDPQQKTLLADKGEIRVGNKYQADITDLLKEDEDDGRDLEKLEEKIWDPSSSLTEKQIDQFLVVARSVGTFARALDCSSSVRQPSLHMSAAAASRDITLFHAMDTLHATGYDMTRAIAALVPQGGPVLCRDEMEEWSASEANLFEEALEKYGKDFTDIQQDFLPWKSLTSIIEYYYMWKTTDRYVQQLACLISAGLTLPLFVCPSSNKPNPNQLSNNVKPALVNGAAGAGIPGPPGSVPTPGLGRACESCYTSSSYQWYSWGPPNMQCRLCASCWTYWKKYGGLKMPTRLDGERPGPNRSNMSPHGLPLRHSGSPKFAVKTRQAFYLQTTGLTRMARRLCHDIIRPRYLARHPYLPVNTAAIKAECALRLPDRPTKPLPLKPVERKPLESVVRYLEAHPRPIKPDPPIRGGSISTGSLTPIKSTPILNNGSPTILGKRTYEQHNGLDGKRDRLESSKCMLSLFLEATVYVVMVTAERRRTRRAR
uniref:Metastasis associated 1 n=1 Tax=Amphiprion ocellaris TaxID=80972 RepID=A0AAQ5XZL2_AMPOC